MSTAAPDADLLVETTAAVDSPRFLRRLIKRKLGIACVLYFLIILGIAVVAPLVLPGIAGQHSGDLLHTRQGPSWSHLLGTDTLGRDVLDRLLVGTRVTMVGVAEALVATLALGVPLGLAAGYLGGRTDRVVSRIADLAFALPGIIVILVVLSVFPGSMFAGMLTYAVLVAPGFMRIVRSAVMPLTDELYITAARVTGLTRRYIVTRHILPRVAGPIIVQGALVAAGALLMQTGLSFLGLVVLAPAPSWGGMVADGVSVIVLQPWLIWPPGAVIALTILALGLFGDTVRDVTTEAWSAPARRTRRRDAAVSTSPWTTVSQRSLLAVHDLRIAFRDPSDVPVRVVDGVSFDIRGGETVGLVGESGCGKTITAMSILGLLPGTGYIEGGNVVFDAQELTTLHPRAHHRLRGSEIGFVSQEPMSSFDPVYRIGTQLAEVVATHHGLGRAASRKRAIALLSAVHLEDAEAVARRYPHELSGGMAQRVAIARALAGEPRLLIADEPTTALDVTLQAEILELMRELQRERGMAILLVTHDWGVVAGICDRAVVMYAGQVVERAEVAPIFNAPLHPYTEALLAANPHEAEKHRPLPTIPGSVPRPRQWPRGCRFHPRCAYATSACEASPILLEQVSDDHETRCIHHDALVNV